ncbi:hypothetical protein [Jannaschia aquimarina]|nr:hypothetical protein [Jannaschia aquimarina]
MGPDLSSLTEPVRLSDGPTYRVSSPPEIVTLSDGGFIVTYDSVMLNDGTGLEIEASCFDAGGARVGAEFQLNTDERDHQQFEELVELSDGSVLAVWMTNDARFGDNNLRAQKIDAEGNFVGGEYDFGAGVENSEGRRSRSRWRSWPSMAASRCSIRCRTASRGIREATRSCNSSTWRGTR